MKATRCILLLIAVLSAMPVMAQEEPATPSDVVILDKRWRAESVDPRGETNPLRPNEALLEQTRAEKAVIKERDDALPNQTTESRRPVASTTPITPGWLMLKTYTYQMTVKNTGRKTIKVVDWEYQFLDPKTREVKEQRNLTNEVSLSPGKTKVLKRRVTRKPTGVVDADQLGLKYRDQFIERVVINRIVYADGTIWQRLRTE